MLVSGHQHKHNSWIGWGGVDQLCMMKCKVAKTDRPLELIRADDLFWLKYTVGLSGIMRRSSCSRPFSYTVLYAAVRSIRTSPVYFCCLWWSVYHFTSIMVVKSASHELDLGIDRLSKQTGLDKIVWHEKAYTMTIDSLLMKIGDSIYILLLHLQWWPASRCTYIYRSVQVSSSSVVLHAIILQIDSLPHNRTTLQN